jgi:hypothetical protein
MNLPDPCRARNFLNSCATIASEEDSATRSDIKLPQCSIRPAGGHVTAHVPCACGWMIRMLDTRLTLVTAHIWHATRLQKWSNNSHSVNPRWSYYNFGG